MISFTICTHTYCDRITIVSCQLKLMSVKKLNFLHTESTFQSFSLQNVLHKFAVIISALKARAHFIFEVDSKHYLSYRDR